MFTEGPVNNASRIVRFHTADSSVKVIAEIPGVGAKCETRGDSRRLDPTRVDVSARELVAFGPSESTVEEAFARAIDGVASAGRWDVVAQLAKELEARRPAAVDVVLLAAGRAT